MPAQLSLATQLTLIGLHWLGLAYLRFPFWEYIGPMVLLATIIPATRVRLMSGLNIAFVAMTGSLLAVSTPTADDLNNSWPPYWVLGLEQNIWLVNLAIYAGFILLYWVLFEAFARLKSIRYPVSVGLIVIAILIGAIRLLDPDTALRGIAIGLMFAVTRGFWAMCYQLSETDYLKRLPFVVHLGTLTSPWQSGWASNVIVRGYSDYSNSAAVDLEKFRRTQWSGVRLMAKAVVFEFIATLFFDYMFAKGQPSAFSLATGLDFSTKSYLAHSLPRSYAWLFVLCTIFHFLLSLTAFTHAAVSIARMCGFDVWRNVYRPLEANSFNNFLSRIYFYYISVIQRFFFYPIWRVLRGLPSRRWRAGITILFAIFIGGMVTSFLRYIPFHFDDHASLIRILESRIAYFALLGLFCCVSALTPSWPGRWENSKLRYLRGLWYCLLYALCYSTQMRTLDFDGFAGFYALAYLFGF